MKLQTGARLMVAVSMIAVCLPASAWNEAGHQVIAAVATQQLTPEARRLVIELLGNDDLVAVAARLDRLQSRGIYSFTRKWTYADIPMGEHYDRKRDCPDGECLVAAIDSFSAAVADRALPKEQRAVALVLLVQLVGDIEQPFHCVIAPGGDHGASRTKVKFASKQMSLHSVWDEGAIRGRQTMLMGEVSELAATIRDAARKDAPAKWATAQSLNAATQYVPAGGTVDADDLRRKVPLHLAYASVRLAWMLERAARGHIQRTEPEGPAVPDIPLNVLLGNASPPPADEEDASPEATAEPTTTTTATTTTGTQATQSKTKEDSLTDRAIQAAATVVSAYLLGVVALLLLTWRGGSTLISRSWLWRAAIYPIRINPILGRWLLFLGYRRRLAQRPAVQKVSDGYFGLPAVTSTQQTIASDATGESLHREVAALTADRQPLFVVGPGGAGKSTLMARLAYLGIHGLLPDTLRGFTPILMSAMDYTGDVLSTIATTLRDREAVDMPDDPAAQREILQSGRFLILFDGLSEIAGDREKALRDFVTISQANDFATSRFIIATRPGLEGLAHQQIIELRPLAPAVIRDLLERLRPPVATRNRMLMQLESLGEKPIEPLLFRMMLRESEEGTSSTRSELYERYFRTLMQIGRNNQAWRGWELVLGEIASAFLLTTGKRGTGMRHEELLDFLGRVNVDARKESLSQRLARHYGISVDGELGLVSRLESAGILTMDRRWRFSHDTFEEYFAAAYLVASFESMGALPPLWPWLATDEHQRDFLKILDFVREKADGEMVRAMSAADIPTLWRERLTSVP